MTITLQTILTAIGGIITWLIGKDFLLPQILKLITWIKERKKERDETNVNATKELTSIKKENNEVYENQITFLLNQIQHLENELIEYSKQLERLRNKILELNDRLYNKQLIISKLRKYCCANESCELRQECSDEFCQLDDLMKKNVD